MTDAEVYGVAAGLGIMAGMRSMSAPALVSQIARKGDLAIEGSRLAFLNARGTLSTTALLAVGELIADKLPATPARTEVGPLAGRAASGAISAAIVCSAKKRSPLFGALIGAAAAVGAAYAAYHLRRMAQEKLHVPDLVLALAEDGLVAGSALNLARRLR